MPFTQIADIRLYYEIAGLGPRLLSISGSGGDLRMRPNVFGSPLAELFEILAYDQHLLIYHKLMGFIQNVRFGASKYLQNRTF